MADGPPLSALPPCTPPRARQRRCPPPAATRRSSASRSTSSCARPPRCSAAAPNDADAAGAQLAHLPGLPGPARRPARHQPRGRPPRARHGPRHRGPHPASHALGPQELLLPGPAQGLPDQPVRAAPGVGRPARGGDLATAPWRWASRGPTSRRTRPASSTRAWRDRPVSLLDYDRSGVAAHGDRHRAGHPRCRDGAALRRGAAPAARDHRRLGRGHGERPDARRGQRLAAAGRHGGLRDPRRGQEHELVPLGRAGHRLRDRAPGGRPARGRAAHPGDARLGRRPRPHLPHAHQGDLGRLPLLPRAGPAAAARWTPPGSTRSAARCRSCPPRDGGATATSSACPPTTPTCSSGDAAATALFEAARAADPGAAAQEAGQLGHAASTCAWPRARLGGDCSAERVSGEQLAALVRLVEEGAISGHQRQAGLRRSTPGAGGPWRTSWPRPGLGADQRRDALRAAVAEVLAENPAAVADVRAGTDKAIGFLTGQVMKKTRGQANAAHRRACVKSARRRRAARRRPAELAGADCRRPVPGDRRTRRMSPLGLAAHRGRHRGHRRRRPAHPWPARHHPAPRRDRRQPRALRDVAGRDTERRGRRPDWRRRDARPDAAARHPLGRPHRSSASSLIVAGLLDLLDRSPGLQPPARRAGIRLTGRRHPTQSPGSRWRGSRVASGAGAGRTGSPQSTGRSRPGP